jgi:Cyclin, N-terminal domain
MATLHRKLRMAAATIDDVVLRAPLHGLCRISSRVRDVRRFDDFVRPSISALLVGANVLELSVQARFTAAVLLHRYYQAIGVPPGATAAVGTACVQDDPALYKEAKYVVGACLLLACKREEEHRRLRDLVNFVGMVDWKVSKEKDDGSNVLLSVDDPSGNVEETGSESKRSHTTVLWRPSPPELDASYWHAKQRLVQTEQRVLQYLAFDISVSRPHRAVLLLLHPTNATGTDVVTGNDLVWQGLARTTPFPGQDSLKHHGLSSQLLQSAMCILNGSVYSSAVLRHAVLPLAVAAITMAASHVMAQSSITTTAVSSQSQHYYGDVSILTVALELIETQWWVPLAPVSLDDAKAAIVSFQSSEQPDKTDPLSPVG